jgi:hypothetical protein
MHDSFIWIDLHEDESMLYFRRFFCVLGPCLQGFSEGCRSYLNIDFTTLNGR